MANINTSKYFSLFWLDAQASGSLEGGWDVNDVREIGVFFTEYPDPAEAASCLRRIGFLPKGIRVDADGDLEESFVFINRKRDTFPLYEIRLMQGDVPRGTRWFTSYPNTRNAIVFRKVDGAFRKEAERWRPAVRWTMQFHHPSLGLPEGTDVHLLSCRKTVNEVFQREAASMSRLGGDSERAEALVWKTRVVDVTDVYPDYQIKMGPRGGVQWNRV